MDGNARIGALVLVIAVALYATGSLVTWWTRAAVGARCQESTDCRSLECIPDVDLAALDLERRRRATPHVRVSTTLPSDGSLPPKWPGYCTERCDDDDGCPATMYCGDGVSGRTYNGFQVPGVGSPVRVCLPDHFADL